MHAVFARRAALLALAALPVVTTGCVTVNTRKEQGAAAGAVAGAAAGALIGRANGSTARGAIIGAVLGGTAGAVIGHQMDQRARELQQNIAGARVERVGEGILVTFESGLLYDFNSADVKPTAQANLRELARNFTKYGDTELLIVGHTDSVGTAAYNASLSQRRADAAAAFLAAQGVPRARLRTEGKGPAEPVARNDSENGRSQNRRVEVAIFASESLKQRARQQAGDPAAAAAGRDRRPRASVGRPSAGAAACGWSGAGARRPRLLCAHATSEAPPAAAAPPIATPPASVAAAPRPPRSPRRLRPLVDGAVDYAGSSRRPRSPWRRPFHRTPPIARGPHRRLLGRFVCRSRGSRSSRPPRSTCCPPTRRSRRATPRGA
jgi:outer membrane protein OmpA-like peptidoglycan-associated protein